MTGLRERLQHPAAAAFELSKFSESSGQERGVEGLVLVVSAQCLEYHGLQAIDPIHLLQACSLCSVLCE